VGGGWGQLGQILDRFDDVNIPAAPIYTNGLADAALFIHHVQELACFASHHLIELEVDPPDVVQIFGAQPLPAPACG
jgi:hypothetical protein